MLCGIRYRSLPWADPSSRGVLPSAVWCVCGCGCVCVCVCMWCMCDVWCVWCVCGVCVMCGVCGVCVCGMCGMCGVCLVCVCGVRGVCVCVWCVCVCVCGVCVCVWRVCFFLIYLLHVPLQSVCVVCVCVCVCVVCVVRVCGVSEWCVWCVCHWVWSGATVGRRSQIEKERNIETNSIIAICYDLQNCAAVCTVHTVHSICTTHLLYSEQAVRVSALVSASHNWQAVSFLLRI